MNDLFQALRFLTRLPLPLTQQSNQQISSMGSCVPWFAFVGLVLGSLLAALAWLLVEVLLLPSLLSATLIVTAWVSLTGALHLDGLADCADARMSCTHKERMLEIMQDSRSGVGGVVALVLALMVKSAAVVVLLEHDRAGWLILSATIGRAMMVLVLLYVPYVRAEGLGKSIKQSMQSSHVWLGLLLPILLLLLVWPLPSLFAIAGGLIALACVWLWIIKPLGGANGDVYGAVNECAEIGVLIALCLMLS